MGCVYFVTCDTCKEVLDPEVRKMVAKPGGVKSSQYIGMCATSLHNRQKTHRERHLVRDKHNVMVKHEVEKHNGTMQRHTAKLV